MLKGIALGGATGLAGCLGGGDGGGGGNGSDGNNGGGGGGGNNSNGGGNDSQGQQQQGNPSIGGTFTLGDTADPSDLNPLRIGEGATSDRVAMLFDGGMDYFSGNYADNPDSWYEPFWIESYDVADSLDSVTVKFRENLQYGGKWGQLTAEDYMYNIKNIFKSDWYPYTYQSNFFVGPENEKPVKFTKEGKYTIREELPGAYPFWPYNDPLQFVIPAPKKFLKPYVKKKDAEGLNKDPQLVKGTFNGNLGPWDFKEWNRQSLIVFERAKNYYLRDVAKNSDQLDDRWAKAPYYEKFEWQLFDEESTARSALKAGQIDQTSIPGNKLENFQGLNDVQIWENPYIAYSDYTGINQRANGWEPLRNRKVRYAIANLYNRNFVVETILKGRGSTQGTLYPQWGSYYPDEGVKRFEWTVEKAKQLLKEGTPSEYGYSGDKFVDGSGNQVELSCVYQSSTLDDLRAQYLKSRLGKAGIKVNLNTTNWTSILQDYFTSKYRAKGVPKDKPIGYGPKGDQHPSRYNWGPRDLAVSKKPWDLMLTLGFSYGPLDPAGTTKVLFAEKESFNAYGHVPSFDMAGMVNKAKTAKSKEAAASLVRKVLKKNSVDQPVAFESNYYSYTGFGKNVQGLPESPAADFFVDTGAGKRWAWLYDKQ